MSGFDSKNKRRSAVTGRTFPIPDGLIDKKDRQHLSLRSYRLTPRDEPQPDQEPQRGDCIGCEVSGSELANGCYELAGPEGLGFTANCGYCYPTPAIHPTYPCKLLVPVGSQPALCNAFGLGWAYEQHGGGCDIHPEPGGYAMRFDPDDVDVEPAITSTPFRSNTQYRYLLRAVDLLIGPCMNHQFGGSQCGGDCCRAYWLCKVYSWGADGGWTMQCNTPERATTPGGGMPHQYANVEKRFKVYPDTGVYRAPLFVETAPTTDKNCFQFVDRYCWSDACDAQVSFPEWDCIGHQQKGSPLTDPREGWKPRHYLDRLYIYFSDDFGVAEDNETYPHKVAETLSTRNRQFRALSANVTQIDGPDNAPGHNSREDYRSSRISKWRGVKTWAITSAPLAIDDGVAKTRTRNLEVVAKLRLTAAKIWLTLNVEKLYTCRYVNKDEHRLHASITVTGYYQWRRDAVVDAAMETAGLSFLTDDLGDWRIADPDDSALEHPSEFWYFRGDNGERINRTVTWRGLRSQWPYAAPNFSDFPCNGTSGSPGDDQLNGTTTCCDAYQMIENTNVYGEWNNCRTTLGDDGLPDPNIRNVQRFRGHVYFACPGLNNCGPERPQYVHGETGAYCGCPDQGVGYDCD